LYKFADEVLITPEKWDQVFTKIKASDIIGYSGELKEDDVIINFVTMNYGMVSSYVITNQDPAMKDKNPVDNVHFFSRWDQTGKMIIIQ
jgi:hypothetical protein